MRLDRDVVPVRVVRGSVDGVLDDRRPIGGIHRLAEGETGGTSGPRVSLSVLGDEFLFASSVCAVVVSRVSGVKVGLVGGERTLTAWPPD